MADVEIIWQDPPPRDGRSPVSNPKYWEFAEALRARPLEWALFGEDLISSTASNIRCAKFVAFSPAYSFETRFQRKGPTKETNRGTIWVRYVGAPNA